MTTASNKLPKYFNISREIIAMIQRGEMLPGAAVPSENEIIDKYEVSNTTARKALHDLERAGWVTRIKGKGTFVRNNTVERSVNRIFGFTKNMVEAGRKPSTRLIGFHLRDEDHSRTINLRECTLKGPYCEIERIRYADGVPMMKETRYISLQFCPDIHRKNLEHSLFEIYEKSYSIRMIEFDQMLSTVLLEGDWLKVFKLDKPVPAFRVEGVTFCGKGLILELEDAYYRGDMYRFSAKATA